MIRTFETAKQKRTFSSTQVASGFLGFPIMGTFDPPRTFGGSLGCRF